jgi:flavin-dependent dehydrogenase
MNGLSALKRCLKMSLLKGRRSFIVFLDPGIAPGYLAWAVHDGEQVHIGVGGYPARFDPVKALKQFRASLTDILDLRNARFVERRGGRIPVGGVLRRIANADGLLLGDAAGAVSPLTAGGLDPCIRLSVFAATVIGEYLESGNPQTLAAYSGQLFRSRFVSRLWMRRIIAAVSSPLLLEMGCGLMRLPLFNSFARHVFFGRGSFPDLQSSPVPSQWASSDRNKPRPLKNETVNQAYQTYSSGFDGSDQSLLASDQVLAVSSAGPGNVGCLPRS